MGKKEDLHTLLDLFITNKSTEAAYFLLNEKDFSYSTYDPLEKSAPFFLNYFDAAFFKTPLENLFITKAFLGYFKEDNLSLFDLKVFEFFKHQSEVLSEPLQYSIEQQQRTEQVQKILEKNHLEKLFTSFLPPLETLESALSKDFLYHEGSSYLLYLEPSTQKIELSFFRGKKGYLILPSLTHLHHLLKDPLLFPFLMENDCTLFFLNEEFKKGEKNNFLYQKISGVLCEALIEKEATFCNAFNERTINPLFLLKISQEILFNIEERRYGPLRSLAHRQAFAYEEWKKPQILAQRMKTPFYPEPDFLKKSFTKNKKKNLLKRSQKKLHLVHVVPQLVDGGHAPTRVLKTLLKFRNKEIFDVSVLCTERLTFHLLEYPIYWNQSESSLVRAPHFAVEIELEDVPLYFLENNLFFAEAAQKGKEILEEKKADIVVFHGEDGINSLISSSSSFPLSVFFEHGTLPKYPSFEASFLSTQESLEIYQERFPEDRAFLLPFGIPPEKGVSPFNKKALGIPENSFVFTTISGHLETRITPVLKEILCSLLKKYPHVYFIPIGRVFKPEAFLEPFVKEEVEQRVILLHQQPSPVSIASSFNAYLNEFPFGSGLALLDALAASLPIVSCYNPEGTAQSQYAKNFLGKEWVIEGENPEEYLKMCERLICDPSFYQSFKEKTVSTYKTLVDPVKYVKTFEENLLSSL